MSDVDEYLAKYPPSTFYLHELAGRVRPTLVPFDQAPAVPPSPPAAPRRPSLGAAAMTTFAEVTRADLDTAKLELAAATGATVALVDEAVLQLSGYEANSPYMPSLAEETAAIAVLAQRVGFEGGALEEADIAAQVAGEIARIAVDAEWIPFHDRTGALRTRAPVDAARVAAALSPQPARPEMPADSPQLTAEAEAEVDRLVALSQNARKASYPAVAGRRDRDRGTNVELAGRKIGHYLELAENGDTTVIVGEPDYHEVEVGYDADTSTQAEIDRLVSQAAGLFGTSNPAVPLVNDPGNRSYAPGPESEWGVRTKGPWSSVYGQG